MYKVCTNINEKSKRDATASAAEVLAVNNVLDCRGASFKRTKVSVFDNMN